MIFQDLSKGDVVKCVKGKMTGIRMTIVDIDHKNHRIKLTYGWTDFGRSAIMYSEDDFNDKFVLVAWHN